MIIRPRTIYALWLAPLFIACLSALIPSPAASAHRAGRHLAVRARQWRARIVRSADRPITQRSLLFRRGATARVPNLSEVRPAKEMRGLWVVRDSLESPEQIKNVVANAKQFGFNTLFVQVSGRGDAWYDSRLEPRAEELEKEPASFDPLATVISDAHAAGLQVHAWVNMCYVWSAGRLPKSPEHIVNAHPDWLARDPNDRYQLYGAQSSEGAYLAPSNPQVRQYLHDVIMEIVDHYDVDGIHFDYIRYPNAAYDRSPAADAAFAATVRPTLPPDRAAGLDKAGPAAYVTAFPEEWAQWRRDQITSIVEDISKDVKAAKPWVCISAAVFADYSDAYNARGQDWKRWLRDGALDAVVPMAYSSSTAVVASQIRAAEAAASEYGRACYAGIGSWHISAQSTEAKIEAARAEGAQGVALFSYGGVTDYGASTSYLSAVDDASFGGPAPTPKLASVALRPVAGS